MTSVIRVVRQDNTAFKKKLLHGEHIETMVYNIKPAQKSFFKRYTYDYKYDWIWWFSCERIQVVKLFRG